MFTTSARSRTNHVPSPTAAGGTAGEPGHAQGSRASTRSQPVPWRQRLLALLLAAVSFLGVGVATASPALAQGSELRGGETLGAGASRTSADGRHRLVMQYDGNLVVYGPTGALWSTRTNQAGSRAVMQYDGNLVVYNASNAALWASGTAGNPGTFFAVQNDGNGVMYTSSGAVLYATRRAWGVTRASNGGVAGNCTWYAYDRFKMDTGVYPGLSGNAQYWNENARAAGWDVWDDATSHSIVVFEPWVQGATGQGHVAWVNEVQLRADGRYVHITEMNFNGLYVISSRWVKNVPGMSYILAPSR